MIDDPLFYLIAVPAVVINGISKGGFGGGLGVLSVPLMALIMEPVTAAAIMLPVLCLMDLFGVWAYRGKWDPVNMRILVPAAIIGIGIGTLTFSYLNGAHIRLIVGFIAILFTLHALWGRLRDHHKRAAKPASKTFGRIMGMIAGFTSFIAHAGAPPVTMFLLPQRLNKTTYTATMVVFFISVNYVKLIPYGFLGQLHPGNLWASLVLAPVALLGIGLGIFLHNRVNDLLFYRLVYVLLFITGTKLLWDGLTALT